MATANGVRSSSCSSALAPEEEGETGASPSLHGLASLRPLGQLRESFILAVNQEGLWIIDQHVAHERVLFERVLRQRQAQQVPRQRLLMPMLIDLLPAQMVAFAAIARELEANGFEAEPFGPRTIAIKAAPVGLEGAALERMLVEVLEQAGSLEQAENLEAARTRIAASIACHAAIKVNTPLDRRAHGMAAGGAGLDRAPHQLPTWPSHRPAVCLEGYSAGISPDLDSNPDFLYAALDTTACATFIKESRMKCDHANQLDRKSGQALDHGFTIGRSRG